MVVAPAEVVSMAVTRLGDLVRFTADRAVAGAAHVASHAALYDCDADWITAHADRLAGG